MLEAQDDNEGCVRTDDVGGLPLDSGDASETAPVEGAMIAARKVAQALMADLSVTL